ncbi:MAG: hypothetical protein NTZ94_06975 [Verrucomicrobia bacterium]|jgi:hypothetical protein|nr:hypothetical protein [Verrucomicrobiota bacterium]
MKIPLALIFIVGTCAVSLASDQADALWLQPRSMDKFQILLDRSPFSLPTAEESAPMAERFSITGSATINEEPVVFIVDKNTQNRLMLGKNPDSSGNVLLEYLPDLNPQKMKASIRIDGQVTTVAYAEVAADQPQQAPPVPMVPNAVQPPPGSQPPPGAVNPAQPQDPSQQPRRVIRRRVISGQNPPAQPNSGK